MATERLSSIISQLTPGRTGLDALYVSHYDQPTNPSPHIAPDCLRSHMPNLVYLLTKTQCSQQKNPDDVVITLAIRTPLTKAKKGGFREVPLDGLIFKILEQVVRKSRLDPQVVEDICLGNVRFAGCLWSWSIAEHCSNTGLRLKSRLLRPRRLPRRRFPKHHLCQLCQPLLLLGSESRPRHRQPDHHRQHRMRCCCGSRIHDRWR